MKKLLLNIAFLMGASSMGFAQFTFEPTTADATGVTFVAGQDYSDGLETEGCNFYMPEPTTSAPGMMYAFQDYGYAVYSINDCSGSGTPLAVGAGVGPGNDGTYAVPGSVGFGLNIASGYTQASWAPCVEVTPSFGFTFPTVCPSNANDWNALAGDQNPVSVDLTDDDDKKLYVNYIGRAGSGTPTFNTKLQLFRDPANDAGAGAFPAGAANQPTADFILDNTARQLVVDFSTTTVGSAAILEAVRQISFLYYGTAVTDNYDLKILGFSIGSAEPLEEPDPIVASSKQASSLVASSKLYPNPVSDQANIELNLKSASSVKVTVSDLMGKEVMTVAEGTFSSLNESFSVADLNKGIYTVNYFVNGSAAKAEMLMVR